MDLYFDKSACCYLDKRYVFPIAKKFDALVGSSSISLNILGMVLCIAAKITDLFQPSWWFSEWHF